MGDIVGKVTDPGDFFGAQGAKAAQETSSDLGYKTLGMQQDWMDYIKGQYEPYSEAGQEALGMQMGMLEGLSGGPNYAEAANSPLYQQMMTQGSDAITSNAAATGGLRGGNIQNALVENSQNSMINAANQDYGNQMNYFNTLGAISGQGMQGSQGLGTFGGNTLSGMAGTMSGIGTGALNSAAMQQQNASGLLSAGVGALAMFSDERLKINIEDTGLKTTKGHNIYTWVWNEIANYLGLSGSDAGVIAQEVEIKDPCAVFTDESGFKKVMYARV